jgi:acetoacetyl-CoA synthetase
LTALLHAVDQARAARSQLTEFARFVAARTGRSFADYQALHAFSVEEVSSFWGLFLEWSGLIVSGDTQPVCRGDGVEEARFFPRLTLSWAENLLAERGPEGENAAALIACDETGARGELTRAELRRRVRAIAAALEAQGLTAGDRVAAIARNTAETVVACLAVTSLGASWSSVSPDLEAEAALSRFAQLEPKLLFTHASTQQNGVRIDVPIDRFARDLPSVQQQISLDALAEREREGASLPAADPRGPWRRFPFDHPLFILFSSGTTGPPKCIVHGHGGTLLEDAKEHRLHGDLGPSDRLLFQTSTGWMMWNWTISAIGAGATVVLYDGSVSFPQRDSLLRIAARERVTVLGTSPPYLQYLVDAGVNDGRALLTAVREMHSTGSVLYGHLHRWAKEHLADVPLQSISGGTDILGCFVMGSPWTPTYEGESGCIGLGLDVRAWSADGCLSKGRGELVCVKPFPSRPTGLLADPGGARFHDAYFAEHPGVWTHGDLIELSPRGSAKILGRCDGILNIRGIRIGPGEIYEVLSSAVPEVSQAMAVDQEALKEPGGNRLLLFVVLQSGVTLDRSLTLRVKKELKRRASSAHVPAVIVPVDELPTTFSGKRSESAMQDALNGRDVRNRAALRNPASIDRALAALAALNT